MDKTLNCLNGELKVGDLVISIPEDDYPCLVGTVLDIGKMRYSDQEYVFVNFMHPEYTQNRLEEIERMLCEAYGRPTTPGIWPLDIDNLPMSADSLIRITGIGKILENAILDTEEAASALCNLVRDSPAFARNTQIVAPVEHISDNMHTANQLFQTLCDKLDQNFRDNLQAFRTAIATPDTIDFDVIVMSRHIVSLDSARTFLTNDYEFQDGDMEKLASLSYPLDVVAADWVFFEEYEELDEGIREFLDEGSFNDFPLIVSHELSDDRSKACLEKSPESTSMLGKIRSAEKAQKETPKDKQPQAKCGPEL